MLTEGNQGSQKHMKDKDIVLNFEYICTYYKMHGNIFTI